MNIKKIIVSCGTVVLLLLVVPTVSAHVTVKPSEIGIGTRSNFVVSVPTEETTPTVQLRLLIPEGVQSVRPNVKPGWRIQLVKSSTEEGATVTEIIWSGGSIPAEQRDEFVFSAQAPAEETQLAWKAYQTYGDGDVVAWDSDPKVVEDYAKNNPTEEGEDDDHDAPKPYSQTKVFDDLSEDKIPVTEVEENEDEEQTKARLPLLISLLALLGSGVSLWMHKNKKQTETV